MAKTDLRKYGFPGSPELFRAEVSKNFETFKAVIELHGPRDFDKELTADELLLHPQWASDFCRVINRAFRNVLCERLPDDVILRALLAYRKSGKAKKRPRS